MTIVSLQSFILSKKFQVRHEDFICAHCGAEVLALPTGTRNHCPHCLYSLHVDEEHPGDRSSACMGVMKPVGALQKHGEWLVVQICEKCGHRWQNHLAPDDDFAVLIKISSEQSREL